MPRETPINHFFNKLCDPAQLTIKAVSVLFNHESGGFGPGRKSGDRRSPVIAVIAVTADIADIAEMPESPLDHLRNRTGKSSHRRVRCLWLNDDDDVGDSLPSRFRRLRAIPAIPPTCSIWLQSG
jgi:hypothetical protein